MKVDSWDNEGVFMSVDGVTYSSVVLNYNEGT